jgi:rhamnose transport system permease protein
MSRAPQVRAFLRTYSWEVFLFGLLIVAVIVASVLSPLYLDAFQILYSLQQSMAITGILAVGFMFIVLVGEIDISLPALAAVANVSFASLSVIGVPIWAAVLLIFCATTLAGLFNGLLVVTFSLPSMAVTLGMIAVYRAIALWIGGPDGFGLDAFQPSYVWLGSESIAGIIPASLVLLAVLFIAAYLVVHRSVYGRLLYATGNNRNATYMSGHSVKAIIAGTYGIAGLLAGVAALVFIGQYQSARSDNLTEILLFVVACIALGGFSLQGGEGNVAGLVLSILLLGTIENGMGLANISGSVQTLVIGLILAISIVLPVIMRQLGILRAVSRDGAARQRLAAVRSTVHGKADIEPTEGRRRLS